MHNSVVTLAAHHAHARAHSRILVAMHWWGIGLVALAGCDSVFSIDHVDVHDALTVDAVACPETYNPIPMGPPNVQYRYVPLATTWPKAADSCKSDLEGHTHLVVLDTDAERVAVEQYLIMLTGGFAVHAGYARDTSANPITGFFAVTGEVVPSTQPPWAPNEPNNGAGVGSPEPIVWFGFQTGLVDGPLDYQVGYLCECDHRPITKRFDFQP